MKRGGAMTRGWKRAKAEREAMFKRGHEVGYAAGVEAERTRMTETFFIPPDADRSPFAPQVVWLSPMPERPHWVVEVAERVPLRMMLADTSPFARRKRFVFEPRIMSQEFSWRDEYHPEGVSRLIVRWPEWRRVA